MILCVTLRNTLRNSAVKQNRFLTYKTMYG